MMIDNTRRELRYCMLTYPDIYFAMNQTPEFELRRILWRLTGPLNLFGLFLDAHGKRHVGIARLLLESRKLR